MKFSTLPPASQRFREINQLNLHQWFFQSSKKVFKAQTLLACPKSGQHNCDDQTAVSAYKVNSVISVQCRTYPAEPCSLEQGLERASNPTFYFELKPKHRRMAVKCVNLTRKFLASTLNQITSRFGCYSQEQKVKVTIPYFQKWHFWCQTCNCMTAFMDQIYPIWVEMARHHFESLESISFLIRLSPFSYGFPQSSKKIELNQ